MYATLKMKLTPQILLIDVAFLLNAKVMLLIIITLIRIIVVAVMKH